MKQWWNIKRFDLVELTLIAVGSGVLSYFLVTHLRPQYVYPAPEVEGVELVQKYGPARNSEHEEEWIIRDFFQDKRNGVFVDVGANDYKYLSNTYYLETVLGWSGLAIEPQVSFEDAYRKNRPRSRFLPFFVSDASNEEATMYYTKDNLLVTSSDKSFVERYGKATELKTPTITMDDLLTREHIDTFDFLNMDIELAEPKALKGFDIERFRPALVCIEAHSEVRQQILDYFAAHHYVIVGKYLRVDAANLYFAPLQGSGTRG
jgi:FkbM family methyltransferase